MSTSHKLRAIIKLTWYIFLSNIRFPRTFFFGLIFPLIFISIFSLANPFRTAFTIGIESDLNLSSDIQSKLNQIPQAQLVPNQTEERLKSDLISGEVDLAVLKDDQGNIGYFTSNTNFKNQDLVRTIFQNSIQTQKLSSPNNQLNFQDIATRQFKQIDLVLPGQISFALISTAVFGVAFVMLSLRKGLVLKRLAVSALPKWAVLTSFMLNQLFLALLVVSVLLIFAYYMFSATFIYGLLTIIQLILVSLLGYLSFTGLGLIVATFSKSETTAPFLSNSLTIPQFLLSGTFFPLSMFPDWLATIGSWLPMTLLRTVILRLNLEGVNLLQLWPQLIALILWSVFLYAICLRFLNWTENA
ncbi:MAG: hypothetical protein OHK0017_03600 [Patescibacteria group bacterium]